MLSHCSSLKKLSIFGSRCRLVTPPTQQYAPLVSKLERLDVGIFHDCLSFVHAFPCHSIAHVSVPVEQEGVAEVLLGQLDGNLLLRLESGPDMVILDYTAPASGMRRSFIYAEAVPESVVISGFHATDELLARVCEVRVSSACVALLSGLRALPSCTRFAVCGANEHPLEPPPATLALPKLHMIEIACSAGYSDADARVFVDAAVAQVKGPVRVLVDDGTSCRDITSVSPRDCVNVS
ncbi:hypothetical protein AURDEDRAFT_117388 [Auricularia subglabra TFB-10046 SS5]|uniref:F-box domain-containing protein n=1 Tax=Auricularia subglabra (strain TFB-10046 / SS5) TaxID=717982 RepID=J0D837_AURST|nr:hypothetical protein AURDEDRAFT_117388 [Auricularia subglabra TFB-10046 SS5]